MTTNQHEFKVEKIEIPVIFFIDFSGWTPFLEQIETIGNGAYSTLADILADYFKLMYSPLTALGGLVANRTGDGYLSLIESGTIAERVANAFIISKSIHDYFNEKFRPQLMEQFKSLADEIPSKVRIALHCGPVYRTRHRSKLLLNDEATYDYLSHAINVSSRILSCDLARKYDTAVSSVIFNASKASGVLLNPESLTLESVQMRGLKNPVNVAGVDLNDLNHGKVWGFRM